MKSSSGESGSHSLAFDEVLFVSFSCVLRHHFALAPLSLVAACWRISGVLHHFALAFFTSVAAFAL